jgi:hypothetical protein
MTFRGPAVPLRAPYMVVLGGSEAYGRGVDEPFPDLLAERAEMRVVNLGVHCGGLDVYARDPALTPIIAKAAIVVVQVMPAANMSNRFYSVHPRRNDRFLRHSPTLQALFPSTDFCDFGFTRHLLAGLRRASPDKFRIVVRELEDAWIARMRLILTRVTGRALLLRIEGGMDAELGEEPLFVPRSVSDRLAGLVEAVVACDVSDLMPPLPRPASGLRQTGLHLPAEGHARVSEALIKAIARRGSEAA